MPCSWFLGDNGLTERGIGQRRSRPLGMALFPPPGARSSSHFGPRLPPATAETLGPTLIDQFCSLAFRIPAALPARPQDR